MPHAAIRYSPALCLLSALFTAPLFAQGVQQTANAAAASTPASVAYVYVGTSKGINLYNASSTGKLTLVSGSPFKTTGLMIGSNQKYLITLGTSWVRSYPVKANGAIGAQVSQINTQNYSGRDCGTTNGAVLGHTGQDVYVLLNVPPDGNNVCNAFQSFKIATSGQLTFNGATTHDTGAPAARNLPTFLANNKFAYGINNFDFVTQVGDVNVYLNGESTFTRESNGTLEFLNFYWPFPAPPPADDPGYTWFPLQVTADPSNHLAIAMKPWFDPPFGTSRSPQLASYTADSEGKITTTNTYKNMPYPDVFPTVLNMSPDGKLLAAGGYGGLQVFHFNGGAPITRYSKVLTTNQVNWIRWDKANHLYALSTTGKLYVYTITPTSIAAAPGSPYTISGPAALFVVPN
jgi:hypothetical protein